MGQFKHPNVIQLIGVVTVSKCTCSCRRGVREMVGWGTLALVVDVTLALSGFLLLFIVVFTRQLGLPQHLEQVFLPSVLSVLFYVLEFWLVRAAHASFNSSGRDTGSFNWDYVSRVLQLKSHT